MNEKTRKETIIDRLLELKAITPMEAVELLKDDYKYPHVPVLPITPIPMPQQPAIPQYPMFPQQQDWRQKWVNEELDRRAKYVENCPCNPKNGGSGMCGCTMSGSIIMC